MPNTYTLKPPVVDTIFYTCGCLSKDDQTIYCAIHRSIHVPKLDPVQDLIARLRAKATWYLKSAEQSSMLHDSNAQAIADLLTEAADLLGERA